MESKFDFEQQENHLTYLAVFERAIGAVAVGAGMSMTAVIAGRLAHEGFTADLGAMDKPLIINAATFAIGIFLLGEARRVGNRALLAEQAALTRDEQLSRGNGGSMDSSEEDSQSSTRPG